MLRLLAVVGMLLQFVKLVLLNNCAYFMNASVSFVIVMIVRSNLYIIDFNRCSEHAGYTVLVCYGLSMLLTDFVYACWAYNLSNIGEFLHTLNIRFAR